MTEAEPLPFEIDGSKLIKNLERVLEIAGKLLGVTQDGAAKKKINVEIAKTEQVIQQTKHAQGEVQKDVKDVQKNEQHSAQLTNSLKELLSELKFGDYATGNKSTTLGQTIVQLIERKKEIEEYYTKILNCFNILKQLGIVDNSINRYEQVILTTLRYILEEVRKIPLRKYTKDPLKGQDKVNEVNKITDLNTKKKLTELKTAYHNLAKIILEFKEYTLKLVNQ